MNKKLGLVIIMLASINAYAMQQQKPQDQQQTQPQKDKKKPRRQSNDKDKPSDKPDAEDAVVSDLLALMNTVVNAINKQEGSIDNHIKNTQKKKRIILCDICFKPECPYSKEVYD
jgi:hypothetical protein